MKLRQTTFDELGGIGVNGESSGRDRKVKEVKGSYELPESWRWVKLGEITIINPSKSEMRNLSPDLEVSFIPMECVDGATGIIVKQEKRKLAEVEQGYTYFKEGDVLFAKITPCMENGKCAVAKKLINGIGFGSTEFHVIRPIQDFTIPEWIWLYLRQEKIRCEATRYFTGSVGQQRVPKEFLERLEIPLPPLEEQKRIVARIEELFSKIERIKELRKQAKEQAENLLKAALHHVFSKADEKGWRWVKLRDVFEIQQGKSLSPKSRRGVSPYPFLRTINVKWGYVDVSSIDYMDFTEEEKRKLSLKAGDLLVCEGGEVGRAAVWRNEIPNCSYQNHIHRLRAKSNNVLPEFVMFWMMYAAKVLNIFYDRSSNTTISNLSAKRLGVLKVPLPFKNNKPDLEEQKRISAYLDRIAEKQRKLLELYEKTEKELETMKQAILSKAFKGLL